MSKDPSPQETKDIVIRTLQSYAAFIFEINRDEIMTGIWAKDPAQEAYFREKHLNTKMADIRNDKVVTLSRKLVQRAFETGENGLIEYITEENGPPSRSIVRIFQAPYDPEYVLSVVEAVKNDENIEVVEDKWKLALDASGDGFWDINLETSKIFFSPKWHELFGYTEDEISEASQWSDKIHPEDIPAAQSQFAKYLGGIDPSYTAEMRYRCKDGSYKWILSRGIVAGKNKEGKPIRFIGTHTDIHQRKIQERQVSESEKRYKILFDHSEAMICTHDLDGIILTINPFICKALGYAQGELIGRNLSELIPAAIRDRFREDYLDKIIREGAAEGVMKILTRTGETRTLLFKNYLFNDEEDQPYIIGFAQDITERVRAERELKNSVATFSSAFRHSGIGMALVSPRGRWLEVNDALCAITGYSQEELQSLTFHDITHPDDLAKDLDLVRQMLARSIDSYTIEKRYLTKTRDTKWVSLTVSLVWEKEKPKFFIAQVVDITARVTLTSELYEKNSELETAKNSLVNKVHQLEELSYIIAHNLRGPAHNIQLLADVLKAKHGKETTHEDAVFMSEVITEEEAAVMIGDGCTSLINSLESLLNIAQIRLNKDIPYDDCDIEEIIDQIVAQLKGDILEKKVVLKKNLDVKEISYPRPYLESVVYNLISNAIKYRSPHRQPHIEIKTVTDDGKVLLSVKDNGSGIDLEKHADKIFKLNQVFHGNKDSKGIGLYLLKTQIEALGGSIEVRSKVNEGTEFVVSF